MELTELQKNWNEFGKRDPFWAVLTDPRCRNNKWDPAEFFASGESDVQAALDLVGSCGLRISRWRALDFGCAMGRLTQALCNRFSYCCGVDIAPSMIELANDYNNFPERCQYFLNAKDDLTLFPSACFDFVYTRLVLQHIRPPHNRRMIAELVRVLDQGGALVFQIPSELESFTTPPEAGLRRLPLAAYRASIRVSDLPSRIPAGRSDTLTVRVKNLSAHTWPCTGTATGAYFIQLGNHWRREDGSVAVQDDGRMILSRDLGPGEEVELRLPINAPGRPGEYILELDMVEEGVTWFREQGSQSCTRRVRVTPSGKIHEDVVMPVMEMHGVPREEVLQVVESAGGNIVKVVDDHSAGCWVSYLYVVTKG